MIGPTDVVARFAVGAEPLEQAPEVLAPAGRGLLDTLGVAVAGVADPAAAIVRGYVLDQGAAGACSLFGHPARTTAPLAALANATAGHALDFDDTNHTMRGRPSAAVVPALLAVAERAGCSGRDLLAAYAVAVEVESGIGQLTAETSYARGWQTSCTLAVIGAAAGCCRLQGLSTDQTVQALGLAVAQASGSRRSFGSMAKPFQVGHASQAAVLAADLAARGMTAGDDALEGEAGYFDLYAQPVPDAAERLQATLGQPYNLVDPGLNVKVYPCGAAGHAAIEGLLALVDGVRPEDVGRIIADVRYTAPLVAHHHRPTSGLEGKFSLEYCLAAVVLDHEVTLRQFTDEMVRRPAAQALLPKVEARVPPDMARGAVPWPPAVAGRVELHLRDGEVRRQTVVAQKGQGNLTPLTDAELDAKFLACATMTLPRVQAEHALELIRHLEELVDLSELTRCLAGES